MILPMKPVRRLPAEWEKQDAVLLAWPHAQTDWNDELGEVVSVYLELTRQITRFQQVIIITPEPLLAQTQLRQASICDTTYQLLQIDTNDTWIRDFGPITVYDKGQPVLLDFSFNGWGLKFAANHDNLATRKLAEKSLFSQSIVQTTGLILEGGSIESDGQGTLLTTANCLLEANRNPQFSRKQLERELLQQLGAKHILWLEHGWLAGDDTDAHIDTLARLCPADTILYVSCGNQQDEHFPALQRMEQQLKSFRTPAGKPYQLLPLPWPAAQLDGDQRLPATYANFLVINGAVLVPCYRDQADTEALQTIARAYPDREIIGIDCCALIKQHGSLHCITMQLPAGVLPCQA